MILTQTIDDIYVRYLLLNRDMNQLIQQTNKSRATLQKYITIKERLDFSLFEKLDKKGNEKITLDVALFMCKRVLNPNIHPLIYQEIQFLKTKEKKQIIHESTRCIICADESMCMEQMPCCSQYYTCESCIMNIIQNTFENVSFDLPKCPFCNLYFKPGFILRFLQSRRKGKELWITTLDYSRHTKLKNSIFLLNCGRIIEHLFNMLENYYETNVIDVKHARLLELGSGILCDTEHDDPLIQSEINTLKQEIEYICGPKNKTVLITDSNIQKILPMIQKDKIFGTCYSCKNNFGKELFKSKLRRWSAPRLTRGEIRRYYKLCSIDRQCANQENELFEVKENMFQCEDCSDGTIKQCPHCGIKTLKPDGCNYVICGDHRWCWICEERLEVSHGGHNEHYYTGPGSSPYSNQCRQSMKINNKPRFILDTCNCLACKDFQGLPICKTFDCMNRTFYVKYGTELNNKGQLSRATVKPNAYCKTCQESILIDGKDSQSSMINYYTELNQFVQEEPHIANIYYM